MKTKYPFKLPEKVPGLPRPRRDGVVYLDAKVRGKWEGVLVVNTDRECVGIRFSGKVIEWELPFHPEDIEDIRSASLWNRIIVEIPEGIVWGYPYACLLIVPLLIFLERYVGITGPIAAILAGIAGQIIILQHMKGYCLTGLPLIMITLSMQAVALLNIVKGIANN